jgi:rhomboid protease GluP
MATVMAVSFLAREEVLLVGASGCVMGLLGATGALMLRGWLREKAVVARRRLALMVWIVVMEIVFDCTVPHVSMTAHLSGALIGFAATLLLRDRLTGTALTSSRQ